MSSSLCFVVLTLSILLLPTSSEFYGQINSQMAEPPACTHTSKSYPEAVCLGDLAHVYMDQQKFDQAEAILKRELQVREKAVGPNDPDIVSTLDRLALLCQKESRYPEGEALLKRAL